MQLTNLKTHLLGKHYEFYKEIDSTQNEIWRRINENNIKNGTVISAGIQTQVKELMDVFGIQMSLIM